MNVARMAKIPASIVEVAEEVAAEFDSKHSSKRLEAETASLQSLACFKTMMEEQNSLILSRANIRMSQGIDAGRN